MTRGKETLRETAARVALLEAEECERRMTITLMRTRANIRKARGEGAYLTEMEAGDMLRASQGGALPRAAQERPSDGQA